MGKHLCYRCARSEGYSSDAEIELPLDTDYQLEKFIKHTRPDRVYRVNSLFEDPSSNAYFDLIVNGAAAGSVEVDDKDRASFIWIAGKELGATYHDGKFFCPDDALKIVLPFEENRIHAYPVSSSGLARAMCDTCGAPILE